jgi:hypothetical protein
MGKIKGIKTIYSRALESQTYDDQIVKTIEAMQKLGYEVEIQHSMSSAGTASSFLSCMIIGREKSIPEEITNTIEGLDRDVVL